MAKDDAAINPKGKTEAHIGEAKMETEAGRRTTEGGDWGWAAEMR